MFQERVDYFEEIKETREEIIQDFFIQENRRDLQRFYCQQEEKQPMEFVPTLKLWETKLPAVRPLKEVITIVHEEDHTPHNRWQRWYKARKSQKRLMRSYGYNRKFKCSLCNRFFASHRAVGGHVSKVHPGQSKYKDYKKKWEERKPQRDRAKKAKRFFQKLHGKPFSNNHYAELRRILAEEEL